MYLPSLILWTAFHRSATICLVVVILKLWVLRRRFASFFKVSPAFFGLNLFSLAISLVLTISHDFQNPRPSHDAKMLGEMIFGSVAMTYKGQTVKVHEIRYALFHKAWWQAWLASACLNWLCSLYWQAINFILLCFFMCICIKSTIC